MFCDETSFGITNNWFDQDAAKPHYLENVLAINVENDYKIYYYPPDPSWVIQDLCVDMDCDGPKHSLVVDRDGLYLGNGTEVNAAVPVAEIRFDSSKVPAIMRTNVDGTIIPTSEVYKNEGIYRGECKLNLMWNAYLCRNTSYNMFILENLDADSLTRRISPVGLSRQDNSDGNFMDLLNGPKVILSLLLVLKVLFFRALVGVEGEHACYD